LTLVKTLGISKSIKTIIQTVVPDLRGYDDISDFIMRGAFASESDVEDAPEATVTIAKADVSEKRAIKLFELGPRLDLKLIKIQDGLCGGEVIHHAFSNFDELIVVEKTDEQVKELKSRKEKERAERDKRRAEQERNVKLKELKKKPEQAVKEDQEEIEFNQEDFDDLMESESDGSGEDAVDADENDNDEDLEDKDCSNASDRVSSNEENNEEME
jgi:ribosome biogenesis protein SSF1/2